MTLGWFLILALTAVALVVVVMRARLQRRRSPEILPGTPEYEQRLAQPAIEAVQEEVGATLPEAVLRLYRDPALVSDSDLTLICGSGRWEVQRFVPLDRLSLRDHAYGLDDDSLPIALHPEGGVYYVKPAEASGEDVALHYVSPDGDRHELVSRSLDAALSSARARTSHGLQTGL
jgi:hypothetical protein